MIPVKNRWSKADTQEENVPDGKPHGASRGRRPPSGAVWEAQTPILPSTITFSQSRGRWLGRQHPPHFTFYWNLRQEKGK